MATKPKLEPPRRERKFRVVNRNKSRSTLEMLCNNCGHQFTIVDCPQNHYFKCPSTICGIESNLQDVLIVAVEAIPNDRHSPDLGISDEKRKDMIAELLALHPHPPEARIHERHHVG